MDKITLEVIPMTGDCDENTEFFVKGKVKTRVSIKNLTMANEFNITRLEELRKQIEEVADTIAKNEELISLIQKEVVVLSEQRDEEFKKSEELRKQRELDFLQKQEDERKRNSESN